MMIVQEVWKNDLIHPLKRKTQRHQLYIVSHRRNNPIPESQETKENSPNERDPEKLDENSVKSRKGGQ